MVGTATLRDDFRLHRVNSNVTRENQGPDFLHGACEGGLWGTVLSSIPVPLLYPGFLISMAVVCWGIRGHRVYRKNGATFLALWFSTAAVMATIAYLLPIKPVDAVFSIPNRGGIVVSELPSALEENGYYVISDVDLPADPILLTSEYVSLRELRSTLKVLGFEIGFVGRCANEFSWSVLRGEQPYSRIIQISKRETDA